MTILTRISLAAGLFIIGATAWAASIGQDPYIGYVYPAGGKQGSVFRVTVAGMRLRAANEVWVSGTGVRASVVGYVGGSGPLNQAQQQELRRRLQEIRERRIGVSKTATPQKPTGTAQDKPIVLPDLPELRNLEQQTPAQLARLVDKFLNNAKRPKAPIAEQVTLEVTVDAGAAPGDRELRLRTPAGLTNPLVFRIGTFAEVREPDKDVDNPPPPEPVQPPVVLNGQIMPGEVDRFRVRLAAGQKIVAAVDARRLIPYLADAVPGWFQAVLAVYDPDGKEIAYDDDYGFDPDPAVVFKVPRDGVYTVEIRDSIYRGRWDFVYRINVGEESDMKPLFPLGSRGGVAICGMQADRKARAELAQAHFLGSTSLNQRSEVEPNDTGVKAMSIKLPQIVNGSIGMPGDRDLYRIEGKAGETVVAEVFARRMGSPLDSLLRLLDSKGRVIAYNDDYHEMNTGLLTHQADSYLLIKLPATGVYYIQVTDAQGHGGEDYGYYLRVSAPQPSFELRITPSALNVTAGRSVLATVWAQRKDGWDGDIDLALKDAPQGFSLSGARIPKGRDHIRITLAAPYGSAGAPMGIKLEGRAQVGGKVITRPVVASDNMMQAFAYQHLVPAEGLLVTVAPIARRTPTLEVAGGIPLRIPAGGQAEVAVIMRPYSPNAQIKLELSDPPAGVTLGEVKNTPNGFSVVVKADDKHIGYADNLIVQASSEIQVKLPAPAPPRKERLSLGALPIPFEIVKK